MADKKKEHTDQGADPANEIVIYEAQDGVTKLNVSFDGDTVWLSQSQMSELFQRDVSTISRHISNVFEEGELEEKSNLQKMQISSSDKPIALYSLDVVISVGYRVKSQAGVHFRKWATRILKEYLIKGFTMDDDRLKEGRSEYWRELFERIRDIRSSEKMLYRQVLDLYATAIDYDPKADESIKFFKIVQNKLHYGAHGHTAAEVIYDRAKAEKEYRVYQERTLAPVEVDYLETIKSLEKQAVKNEKKAGD